MQGFNLEGLNSALEDYDNNRDEIQKEAERERNTLLADDFLNTRKRTSTRNTLSLQSLQGLQANPSESNSETVKGDTMELNGRERREQDAPRRSSINLQGAISNLGLGSDNYGNGLSTEDLSVDNGGLRTRKKSGSSQLGNLIMGMTSDNIHETRIDSIIEEEELESPTKKLRIDQNKKKEQSEDEEVDEDMLFKMAIDINPVYLQDQETDPVYKLEQEPKEKVQPEEKEVSTNYEPQTRRRSMALSIRNSVVSIQTSQMMTEKNPPSLYKDEREKSATQDHSKTPSLPSSHDDSDDEYSVDSLRPRQTSNLQNLVKGLNHHNSIDYRNPLSNLQRGSLQPSAAPKLYPEQQAFPDQSSRKRTGIDYQISLASQALGASSLMKSQRRSLHPKEENTNISSKLNIPQNGNLNKRGSVRGHQLPGLTEIRTDSDYSFESDREDDKKTIRSLKFEDMLGPKGYSFKREYIRKVATIISKGNWSFKLEKENIKEISGKFGFDSSRFDAMSGHDFEEPDFQELKFKEILIQQLENLNENFDEESVKNIVLNKESQLLGILMKSWLIVVNLKNQENSKISVFQNDKNRTEKPTSLFGKQDKFYIGYDSGKINTFKWRNGILESVQSLGPFDGASGHLEDLVVSQSGDFIALLFKESTQSGVILKRDSKKSTYEVAEWVHGLDSCRYPKISYLGIKKEDYFMFTGLKKAILYRCSMRRGLKQMKDFESPDFSGERPDASQTFGFIFKEKLRGKNSVYVSLIWGGCLSVLFRQTVRQGETVLEEVSFSKMPFMIDYASIVDRTTLLVLSEDQFLAYYYLEKQAMVYSTRQMRVTSEVYKLVEDGLGQIQVEETQPERRTTKYISMGDFNPYHMLELPTPMFDPSSSMGMDPTKRYFNWTSGGTQNAITRISGNLGGVVILNQTSIYKIGMEDIGPVIQQLIDKKDIFNALRLLNNAIDDSVTTLMLPKTPKERETVYNKLAISLIGVLEMSFDTSPIIKKHSAIFISQLYMILVKLGLFKIVQGPLGDMCIRQNHRLLFIRGFLFLYKSNLITEVSEQEIDLILDILYDKDRQKLKQVAHLLLTKSSKMTNFIVKKISEFKDEDLLLMLFEMGEDFLAVISLQVAREKIEKNGDSIAQVTKSIHKIFLIITRILNDENRSHKSQIQVLYSLVEWLVKPSVTRYLAESYPEHFIRGLYFLVESKAFNRLRLVPDASVPEMGAVNGYFSRTSHSLLTYMYGVLVQTLEKSKPSLLYLGLAMMEFSDSSMISLSDSFLKKVVIHLVEHHSEVKEDLREDVSPKFFKMMLFSLFIRRRNVLERSEEFESAVKKDDGQFNLIFNELNYYSSIALNSVRRMISADPSYTNMLFDWLQMGIKNLDKKQHYIDMMTKEMEFLASTSQTRFIELLQLLDIEEQLVFVLEYKQRTPSKLRVFKNIFSFVLERHLETELTPQFKVEYIHLLCLFEKKQVFPELRTGKYPPSQCLELVKKYRLQLPTAYLQSRLGDYDGALKILKNRLKKIIKGLEIGFKKYDPVLNKKSSVKIEYEVGLALEEVCDFADNPYKLYMDYLDWVCYIQNRYKPKELKIWEQTKSRVFKAVIVNVKPNQIVDWLQDSGLNLIKNEETMRKLVSHFKELRQMFLTSRNVNNMDCWDLTHTVKGGMLVGHSFDLQGEPKNEFHNSTSYIVFSICKHCHRVPYKRLVYRGRLYCDLCEELHENTKSHNNIKRIIHNDGERNYPKNLKSKTSRTAGRLSLNNLILDRKVIDESTLKKKRKMLVFDKLYHKELELYNLVCDDLMTSPDPGFGK